MKKYQKLKGFLASQQGPRVSATFQEIEGILGFKLPASAYTYPAWWANQAGDGHIQSASWQSAGWRTGELSLSLQQVSFFKDDAEERPMPSNLQSRSDSRKGLTIAEAKAGVALHYGVSPKSVEIIVRG